MPSLQKAGFSHSEKTNSFSSFRWRGCISRFARSFGQRLRIAEIANRSDGHGLEVVRDVEGRLRLLMIEAGHGVRMQPQRGDLHGEVRHRRAGVVPVMAIDLPVVREVLARDGQDEHRRALGPILIERHQ